MNGAFRITTLRNIPIKVHFSFLIALPLMAWTFSHLFTQAATAAQIPAEELGGAPWLWGLGLTLALFLSVFVHELAHATYAIRKGGSVSDITLLMIGGVSRITRLPPKVSQEAWMALVGPLTSLAIGGLAFAAHGMFSSTSGFALQFALYYLGQMNLFLGAFNLLPAFPMDGGRILRSLLSKPLGHLRATQIAGNVGKAFAVTFGVFGLMSFNVVLTLIAVFVYIGAQGETRYVMMESMLGQLRVRELMTPETDFVLASTPLSEVARRMRFERRVAFPVLDEDSQLLGVVSLSAFRDLPREGREQLTALAALTPVEPVSPSDEVWKALREMNVRHVPQLPVVEEQSLVGCISLSDILRGMELQQLETNSRREPFVFGRPREPTTS